MVKMHLMKIKQRRKLRNNVIEFSKGRNKGKCTKFPLLSVMYEGAVMLRLAQPYFKSSIVCWSASHFFCQIFLFQMLTFINYYFHYRFILSQ